ncbi:50S ribosomal protein L6 [candidate division WWE3 bacterium]|nr:50S ribosomal protein L6 [candidate division WWE3 bacterium]
MSRIGKQPVELPRGVEVTIEKTLVKFKGPKGNLEVPLRSDVSVEKVEDKLVVSSRNKQTKAFWGLTRALLANAVKGVTEGYEKELELVGVGYRAKKQGNDLFLTLGFSHPVEFKAPEGIEFDVPDNKNIKITGIDKQLVGLTAAKIRQLRKPEPYKGKGIRYKGEVVRRKPGKSLVGAGAA